MWFKVSFCFFCLGINIINRKHFIIGGNMKSMLLAGLLLFLLVIIGCKSDKDKTAVKSKDSVVNQKSESPTQENQMGLLEYCQSGLSEPRKFRLSVTFEMRNLFLGSGDGVDCLVFEDDNYVKVLVPVMTKDIPSDIIKLKDLAIKNRGALVLVEIAQKAESYAHNAFVIKPENLKFIE